jgi:hypothetical protein
MVFQDLHEVEVTPCFILFSLALANVKYLQSCAWEELI